MVLKISEIIMSISNLLLRLNFFVCVCVVFFSPHYSLYIWTSLPDMWKLGALILMVVPSYSRNLNQARAGRPCFQLFADHSLWEA